MSIIFAIVAVVAGGWLVALLLSLLCAVALLVVRALEMVMHATTISPHRPRLAKLVAERDRLIQQQQRERTMATLRELAE
jgi:hypothetical protein